MTIMVQIRPKYKQKNTLFVSLTSTGKERDSETGFSYFGARYYDSDLMTGWLSVDPMADKYPGLSPYAYCAWNPVKLVDPDGRMVSPIYDADGNFLGTDDKGLQGEALIMNKADFHQGMSNEEARTKGRTLDNMSDTQALEFANNGNFKEFLNHYNSLSSRPDWDGFVTISEGIQWAKDHPNALKNITSDNTLYINATLLNLGSLTISNCGLSVGGDFKNVNLLRYVNIKNLCSVNTTYALGNTSIKLLDNNGTIAFKGDEYDWNYHKNSTFRNSLVFLERQRSGINDTHGFKVEIYGTAKINKKWPF